MEINFKIDETLQKKLFSLLYEIKKDFGIEIFPVSQNFSSSATPLEGGEIRRSSAYKPNTLAIQQILAFQY